MAFHAVCHDCDEFEIVETRDVPRRDMSTPVRLHAAAREHEVALMEVADE
jgi:hypothetical protein